MESRTTAQSKKEKIQWSNHSETIFQLLENNSIFDPGNSEFVVISYWNDYLLLFKVQS